MLHGSQMHSDGFQTNHSHLHIGILLPLTPARACRGAGGKRRGERVGCRGRSGCWCPWRLWSRIASPKHLQAAHGRQGLAHNMLQGPIIASASGAILRCGEVAKWAEQLRNILAVRDWWRSCLRSVNKHAGLMPAVLLIKGSATHHGQTAGRGAALAI